MSKRPDYEVAREELSVILAAERIDLRARFVPFSQSRNAKEQYPSLNWKVDIVRHGAAAPAIMLADIDYMQGLAYCPAYRKDWASRRDKARAAALECQSGRIAREGVSRMPTAGAKDIPPPSIVDVMCSLLMDSDVLNHSGFADWADNFGYDTDSRKAESMYRACLEIALSLRSHFGDRQFAKMQEFAARF